MDRIIFGLEVTAIATALVAGTLSILALSMFLLKKLALWLQRRKDFGIGSRGRNVALVKADTKQAYSVEPPADEATAGATVSLSEGISPGVIAAITASLSAHLNRPAHEIKVRSVSRVPQPGAATDASQWARAGRQERLFGRQTFTL